jgi:hypothetical protein
MKKSVERTGDTWTWTAIEAETRLLITWFVGGRDSDYAIAFMDDVRDRLANRVQLTSYGHKAYLEAVEGAFGADIDYAMLVKVYGASPESMKRRYSPAECIGVRKERTEGNPDPSTSARHLPSASISPGACKCVGLRGSRMRSPKCLRTTCTWSRSIRSPHERLKGISPAMAAGLSDMLWSMIDLTEIVDAAAPLPTKRGPDRKQIAV